MRENNKGFTLIEVIVVIAIMAVLIGVGAGSLSVAERGYLRKSSKQLENIFNTAAYNTQAIAAKEWRVDLMPEGDSYVAKLVKVQADPTDPTRTVEEVEDKVVLSGEDKIKLSFSAKLTGGLVIDDAQITAASPLKISFEKQTGEVNKVVFGASTYDSGFLSSATAEGQGTVKISTSHNVGTKELTIYWSTGKIFFQ